MKKENDIENQHWTDDAVLVGDIFKVIFIGVVLYYTFM